MTLRSEVADSTIWKKKTFMLNRHILVTITSVWSSPEDCHIMWLRKWICHTSWGKYIMPTRSILLKGADTGLGSLNFFCSDISAKGELVAWDFLWAAVDTWVLYDLLFQNVLFCELLIYVFCIFGQVWSKRRKSEGCVKNTVCTYWWGEHSKLVLSRTTTPI